MVLLAWYAILPPRQLVSNVTDRLSELPAVSPSIVIYIVKSYR